MLFKTNDASLAAWLYISGLEWIDTTLEFPAQFIFRNTNGEAERLKQAFVSGEATGNIVAYDRQRRIMVNKAQNRNNRIR